jgi:hypothetical protein
VIMTLTSAPIGWPPTPQGEAAKRGEPPAGAEELLLDLRAGDMCHRPQGHSCGP